MTNKGNKGPDDNPPPGRKYKSVTSFISPAELSTPTTGLAPPPPSVTAPTSLHGASLTQRSSAAGASGSTSTSQTHTLTARKVACAPAGVPQSTPAPAAANLPSSLLPPAPIRPAHKTPLQPPTVPAPPPLPPAPQPQPLLQPRPPAPVQGSTSACSPALPLQPPTEARTGPTPSRRMAPLPPAPPQPPAPSASTAKKKGAQVVVIDLTHDDDDDEVVVAKATAGTGAPHACAVPTPPNGCNSSSTTGRPQPVAGALQALQGRKKAKLREVYQQLGPEGGPGAVLVQQPPLSGQAAPPLAVTGGLADRRVQCAAAPRRAGEAPRPAGGAPGPAQAPAPSGAPHAPSQPSPAPPQPPHNTPPPAPHTAHPSSLRHAPAMRVSSKEALQAAQARRQHCPLSQQVQQLEASLEERRVQALDTRNMLLGQGAAGAARLHACLSEQRLQQHAVEQRGQSAAELEAMQQQQRQQQRQEAELDLELQEPRRLCKEGAGAAGTQPDGKQQQQQQPPAPAPPLCPESICKLEALLLQRALGKYQRQQQGATATVCACLAAELQASEAQVLAQLRAWVHQLQGKFHGRASSRTMSLQLMALQVLSGAADEAEQGGGGGSSRGTENDLARAASDGGSSSISSSSMEACAGGPPTQAASPAEGSVGHAAYAAHAPSTTAGAAPAPRKPDVLLRMMHNLCRAAATQPKPTAVLPDVAPRTGGARDGNGGSGEAASGSSEAATSGLPTTCEEPLLGAGYATAACPPPAPPPGQQGATSSKRKPPPPPAVAGLPTTAGSVVRGTAAKQARHSASPGPDLCGLAASSAPEPTRSRPASCPPTSSLPSGPSTSTASVDAGTASDASAGAERGAPPLQWCRPLPEGWVRVLGHLMTPATHAQFCRVVQGFRSECERERKLHKPLWQDETSKAKKAKRPPAYYAACTLIRIKKDLGHTGVDKLTKQLGNGLVRVVAQQLGIEEEKVTLAHVLDHLPTDLPGRSADLEPYKVGEEDERVGLRGSWGLRAKKPLSKFTILAPYAGLQMLNGQYSSGGDGSGHSGHVSWECRHHAHVLDAMLQLLRDVAAAAHAPAGRWRDLAGQLQVLAPDGLLLQLEPTLQQLECQGWPPPAAVVSEAQERLEALLQQELQTLFPVDDDLMDDEEIRDRRLALAAASQKLLSDAYGADIRNHELHITLPEECNDDESVTVNAACPFGNMLALINDPSLQVPYTSIQDSCRELENCSLLEVSIAGWPFLFGCTIKDVGAETLWYLYDAPYWKFVMEAEKNYKLHKEVVRSRSYELQRDLLKRLLQTAQQQSTRGL